MKHRISGTGAVSVLLVFVLLCIVALGVLSCTTAQTGLTYATENSRRTTAYYNATVKAEEALSALNNSLYQAWNNDGYVEGWEAPSPWESQGNHLELTVEIGDGQALLVKASPQSPKAGVYYSVLGYQTVSTQPWQPDNGLSLLQ